jgi:hypothetical protein
LKTFLRWKDCSFEKTQAKEIRNNKPIENNADKTKISKGKKRKYQDEFLKYGFVASDNDCSYLLEALIFVNMDFQRSQN